MKNITGNTDNVGSWMFQRYNFILNSTDQESSLFHNFLKYTKAGK